jgi:Ca2+/Na+ antiporter
VFNVGLVLGLVVAVATLRVDRRAVRSDLAVALVAPVVTLLALVDGLLVRSEAVFCSSCSAAGWSLWDARR